MRIPGRVTSNDATTEYRLTAKNAKNRFEDRHVRGSRWEVLGIGSLRTLPAEETKNTLPAAWRESRGDLDGPSRELMVLMVSAWH